METLFSELGNWSLVEAVAAVLGVGYVVLAARQNIWCWPCAIASTGLYFGVFFELALYQQAALQLFYIGLSVYGWRKWRSGGEKSTPLRVSNFRAPQHFVAIALIVVLTVVTGWLTSRYTRTPMPYLDAFTAWGGVITSWMMARKVLENWLYWFVVDSLMVVLSWRAHLPATALLFAIYVGMAIVGYTSWRRSQATQSAIATR